eukprot:TRINITY_DN4127_c0_g1_i8.p1 TRINITY_DN4127_c0_g1~~TRINITY_DN4127_c0_g1_i8.p1  ORF type:complete len:223 (-),score=-14.71 TRINITY_DN4127_c0_g1_i8:120-788(-)
MQKISDNQKMLDVYFWSLFILVAVCTIKFLLLLMERSIENLTVRQIQGQYFLIILFTKYPHIIYQILLMLGIVQINIFVLSYNSSEVVFWWLIWISYICMAILLQLQFQMFYYNKTNGCFLGGFSFKFLLEATAWEKFLACSQYKFHWCLQLQNLFSKIIVCNKLLWGLFNGVEVCPNFNLNSTNYISNYDDINKQMVLFTLKAFACLEIFLIQTLDTQFGV